MSTIAIPGWIYRECLDPHCTEFSRDNPDIAAPTYRKRGYGGQYIYDVNDEQAELLISTVLTFGEALSYGADPETMHMARRIVRWVEKREAA